MRKNENKRNNFFILTNVMNVFEQYSRDFSYRSYIFGNANAGGTVAFKSNLKST